MKIVINSCFGGFGLSAKAVQRIAELKGKSCYFFKCGDLKQISPSEADECFSWIAADIEDMSPYDALPRDESSQFWDKHVFKFDDQRTDQDLIRTVEELREEANRDCARLKIIDIPNDVRYEITEYDGWEKVEEVHQSWS